VSKTKTVEQLLQDAENELERANNANQSLLETLSHDLRTPLNTILGFADMMDQEMLGPITNASYRSYTEDICKSGRSMLDIMNDVLERKRFDTAERKGKDFRQIIELAPDLISVCKGEEIQLINPAGANMLGMWPVDTLVGRKFIDFVHPEFKHVLKDGVGSIIDEQMRVPIKLKRADGVEVDIELAALPYEGEEADEDEATVMLVARDVSERNRAIRRLAAREEHLRKVMDTVVDGILTIDGSGVIETANSAIENMFGYRPGELVGKKAALLIGDEPNIFSPIPLNESLLKMEEQSSVGRREVEGKRKDASNVPLEVAISVLKVGGRYVFIGAVQDITERKENEARVYEIATHDPLTGMPNRAAFIERLAIATDHADRNLLRVAVLLIDLDNFKNINDAMGHATGDLLIQAAGKRMEDCVQENGLVTHLGADTFGIILDKIHTEEDTRQVADEILKIIAVPFIIESKEIYISASIGIGVYPIIAEDHTDLLRKVDTAVHHAKDLGRANFQFYTDELSSNVHRRMEIERRLRHALENDLFSVYYQAKVDLERRLITGAEALIRWNDPELGFVSPEEFIPVAEATGLVVPIGDWVLRNACMQAVTWGNYCEQSVQVAVNLSALQFLQGDLINTVKDCLADSKLPAQLLDLELTESMLVENPERTIEMLHELKTLGISIAMDDFGTGYSSLSYLTRFPLDTLKVDRAFVMNLPDDRDAVAIVGAIVGMAQQLNLHIVAEGIETSDQVGFLHQLGCHVGQGYLFSKPVPAEEFEAILQQGITAFEAAE